MTSKTSPTTVRLTDEDHTFLSELRIAGATSISDKIRALISERRRLDEAGRDYTSALVLADSLLDPLKNAVRALENEHQVNSQLVRRVLDLAPDILASLLADGVTPDSSVEDLKAMEQRLSVLVIRVLDAIMQIYVARRTSLYDPGLLDGERTQALGRLCRTVVNDIESSTHNPEEKK